jgi:hypothetical protein
MSDVSESRAEAMMGRNEYAAHRGCAPNAVSKAEKDGRIAAAVVRDERGGFVGIKWRLADTMWAHNTDPAEAAKNGRVNLVPALGPGETDVGRTAAGTAAPTQAAGGDSLGLRGSDDRAAPPADDPVDPPASRDRNEDPHGYLAARADRERFLAERARLDLMERLGVLASTSEVRDETFGKFRQLRDGLFLIAPRVSQRLAGESDPMRIEQMINEQLRTVLNELSRAIATDAAGGVAQLEDTGP